MNFIAAFSQVTNLNGAVFCALSCQKKNLFLKICIMLYKIAFYLITDYNQFLRKDFQLIIIQEFALVIKEITENSL